MGKCQLQFPLLVRQFLPACSHARPAREVTETLAVAVIGFGLVVVLGRERFKRAVVSCGFDGGHVFAEGVTVNVVWAGTGHRVARHVVDGNEY